MAKKAPTEIDGSTVMLDGELFEVQPAGDRGPTYLLKRITFAERGPFNRAQVMAGLRNVGLLDLMTHAIEVMPGLFTDEPEQAERLVAIAEDFKARLEAYLERQSGDEIDWDGNPDEARAAWREATNSEAGSIDDFNRRIARLSETHAEMLADFQLYALEFGKVAARSFLRGWSLDAPLERNARGAADASLELIPDAHFVAIGVAVRQRLNLPLAVRKN